MALSALGRLQQSGIPDTLSSTNVPIEINVPPEADIEITNIKLSATSTNFSGGSFTIRNLSDKDLIAYSLAMNLYFDTNPDRPIQMGVTEDGWFLNQYILKPGESKKGVIRMSLTSPAPVKLTRVEVVPDYIEFSGGKALGANSSAIGASLKTSRDIKAQLLQGYCAKLKSGKSPNSVAALIKSDSQNVTVGERVRQLGMNVLSTYLNIYGTENFANTCSAPLPARAY